jgi:hypothetical protein
MTGVAASAIVGFFLSSLLLRDSKGLIARSEFDQIRANKSFLIPVPTA